MNYLSTQAIEKLEACAAREAEQFALPDDWRRGRPRIEGTAIDHAWARHIDDAITLTVIDDQPHAQVSIADVGSFVPAESATALSVERKAFFKGADLLLANRIGREILSLAHRVDRPTLTVQFPIFEPRDHKRMKVFRSVTRAHLLSVDEVNEQLAGEASEYTPAVHNLYRGALLLHRRSLRQRFYGTDIFSADAHPLDDFVAGDARPADYLVRQYMIAANDVVGRIATSKAIPFLYQRLSNTGLRTYKAVPNADKTNPMRSYAHVTSPLWRGSDFMNHVNLAAHLEGREYPYSDEYLAEMAVWFTHVGRTGMRDYSLQPPFVPKIQAFVEHHNIPTFDQMTHLKKGTAAPETLRDILFSSAVTDITEAKTLAASHLEQNPSLATEVLALAVADGYFTELRDAEGALLGYSANGRTARYTRLPKESYPVAYNLSELRIISELSKTVIIPRHKNLGLSFFYTAVAKRQLRFTYNNYETADGKHQIVIHVVTPNQEDTFRAVATTIADARILASARVHEQFGLLDTLPPEQSILDTHANAWAALAQRQQQAGLPHAKHTFDSNEDGSFTCTIELVDVRDGKKYTFTMQGRGQSKKAAKHAAAELILGELPSIQLSNRSLRILKETE